MQIDSKRLESGDRLTFITCIIYRPMVKPPKVKHKSLTFIYKSIPNTDFMANLPGNMI